MPAIVDSASPSFATAADVATRLGRTLSAAESATAELLLVGATAAVIDAVGKDDAWADALAPVPNMIRVVTIEVAARVMANVEGASSISEQLGAYQYTKGFRSAAQDVGLALTPLEERLVRRTVYGRLSGSARINSVATDLYPEATTP